MSGRNVKFRTPSILTRVREATKGIFFSRDAAKLKKIAKTPTYRLSKMKIRAAKKINKFIYRRINGKLYRKPNPEWEKTYYPIDSSGRPRGGRTNRPRNKRNKAGYNLLRQFIPFDEDAKKLQKLELERYQAMQRRDLSGALASTYRQNIFNQALERENQINRLIDLKRMARTCPPDFVQRRNSIMQERIRSESQFSQEHSQLNAHKNMLSPKENSINFLETKSSILSAQNLFSADNPNAVSIIKTNRPSVLNTKEVGNNIF